MIFYTYFGWDTPFENAVYDENAGACNVARMPVPFYRTKLKAEYSITFCANYALWLLNEKNDEYIDRVCRILSNVLDAQITDIQNEYFGIWLYGLFDTVDEYIAPDYIYQSEISIILMEIYLVFKDSLPDSLVERLKNACCLSAFAVIHHCCEIDASFIIMEILSSICIGEQFNRKEFVNFGVTTLQTLLYYTLYNDAFMEYNYPRILLLSLEAINFYREYITNTFCLSGLATIEKFLLTCFYSHFNTRNLQWTGPISSTDFDFFPDEYKSHIQNIFGTSNLKHMRIPPEYATYAPSNAESFTQLLLSRGFSYPHWKFPTVASFYNCHDFSLGSFNREDMWNQRRPCIAYFGTDASPYCLRIRCLLNGHDFSSATLHSVQHKGNILGHVTLSTNRGNRELATDTAQSFSMCDLRIRFQLLGDIPALECSHTRSSLELRLGDLSIFYNVDYSVFGSSHITHQLTSAQNSLFFDTVLYSGDETELTLSQIDRAITSFSLFMTCSDTAPTPAVTSADGEMLISEVKTPDLSLKLETPSAPNSIEYMTIFDRQYINDVRLERHVDINKKLSGQYRFIAESNISPSLAVSATHFAENKTYLSKIKNLSKVPLEDIDKNVKDLLSGLNNLSPDVARRYSVHIIANIFSAAQKSDVRFKNIISTNYSQVYDELSYTTRVGQMKKNILGIAARLKHDGLKLQTNTKKSDKIAQVIKIINSDYANPDLSLQTIAAHLGVSQAHLSREFHAIIGSSYVEYVLKIRMEHAAELFSAGQEIETVMKKCGYVSSVTFNSAFKRYTGMTAKKYIASLHNKGK